MKNLLFIFLVLFLAFLEATFVPLHLVLLVVIGLNVWLFSPEIFFLSVVSGFILDVVKGKTLGIGSLEFLVLALTVSLYKNRFQAQKLSFIIPLTLICVVINILLTGESFSLIKIMINTGLIIFFLPLTKLMVKKNDNRLRL